MVVSTPRSGPVTIAEPNPATPQRTPDLDERPITLQLAEELFAPATIADIQAGFDQLRVFAECFEDAQKFRIALSNRLGGAERGSIGILAESVTPALDLAERSEKEWKKALLGCYRRVVPSEIRDWQQAQPGVGPHLMARLLGTIGHPVLASPHHWESATNKDGAARVLVADAPYLRNVGKLWAYCGHGDPTRRRRRGMHADDAMALGSPRAKMLVWNLAVATMKQKPSAVAHTSPGTQTAPGDSGPSDGPPSDVSPTPSELATGGPSDSCRGSTEAVPSPENSALIPGNYRDVYDRGRGIYATRDGWTLGHQHAAALRLTGKSILRDLWLAGTAHLDTLPRQG